MQSWYIVTQPAFELIALERKAECTSLSPPTVPGLSTDCCIPDDFIPDDYIPCDCCIYGCRVQGWHTATKPVFEVLSLERKARGASVPLPKAIIKYILSAVLPRVLQRKLLGALPAELGQYLLEAGQGARIAGELAASLQSLLRACMQVHCGARSSLCNSS